MSGVGLVDWRDRTYVVHAERTTLGGNDVGIHCIQTVLSAEERGGGESAPPTLGQTY